MLFSPRQKIYACCQEVDVILLFEYLVCRSIRSLRVSGGFALRFPCRANGEGYGSWVPARYRKASVPLDISWFRERVGLSERWCCVGRFLLCLGSQDLWKCELRGNIFIGVKCSRLPMTPSKTFMPLAATEERAFICPKCEDGVR